MNTRWGVSTTHFRISEWSMRAVVEIDEFFIWVMVVQSIYFLQIYQDKSMVLYANVYFGGLVQNCCNSSASAMALMQFSTEPSIY